MLLPVPLFAVPCVALSTSASANDGGPSQQALETEGDWVGGVAPVPTPPPACGAVVRIQVPWEICGAPELDTLETRDPDAAHRTYDGEVEDEVTGVTCSLVCMSKHRLGKQRWPNQAGWAFWIPPGVDAASLTCSLADGTSQTIHLQDADNPVPVGISAWWYTSIDTIGFSTGIEPGSVTSLRGDNLCPAGQPTRAGGLVDALRP